MPKKMPNFTELFNKIEHYKGIEELIAILRGKLNVHKIKWQKIEHL